MENTKWVSTWANATSIITRQVENYTKDITLSLPLNVIAVVSLSKLPFSSLFATVAHVIVMLSVPQKLEKPNLSLLPLNADLIG